MLIYLRWLQNPFPFFFKRTYSRCLFLFLWELSGINGPGIFKKKKNRNLFKLHSLYLSVIYKKLASKDLRKQEKRMILISKQYSAK